MSRALRTERHHNDNSATRHLTPVRPHPPKTAARPDHVYGPVHRTPPQRHRSTRAAQHDPSTDPRHTPSAQNDGVWTAPAAPIRLPAAKATAPVPLTSATPPTPGSTHQYVNPLVEPSCATGRAYTGPTIEGDGSRTASPPIAAITQECVKDLATIEAPPAPGSMPPTGTTAPPVPTTATGSPMERRSGTPMDEAARDVRLHAGDCTRAIARGRPVPPGRAPVETPRPARHRTTPTRSTHHRPRQSRRRRAESVSVA
jgi:hypothetical protein